jgi:hypothetical protein
MMVHHLAAADVSYREPLTLAGLVSNSGLVPRAADVLGLQRAVARAWELGFDREGRQRNLVGSRKWIGSVDIAATLRSATLRANTRAFSSKNHGGKQAAAAMLIAFVSDYFVENTADWPIIESIDASSSLRPPIVLTYAGHNRLAVGFNKTDQAVLFLEPGRPASLKDLIKAASQYEVLYLRPGFTGLDTQPRQIGKDV